MNGKVFVHRSNWPDWDSPQLLRIQSTVVLLCKNVFDREDENNTYKRNGYVEFYWRYVSLFNKCRFFKKWYVQVCCLAAVTQSSQICNKIFTVVTKLWQAKVDFNEKGQFENCTVWKYMGMLGNAMNIHIMDNTLINVKYNHKHWKIRIKTKYLYLKKKDQAEIG